MDHSETCATRHSLATATFGANCKGSLDANVSIWWSSGHTVEAGSRNSCSAQWPSRSSETHVALSLRWGVVHLPSHKCCRVGHPNLSCFPRTSVKPLYGRCLMRFCSPKSAEPSSCCFICSPWLHSWKTAAGTRQQRWRKCRGKRERPRASTFENGLRASTLRLSRHLWQSSASQP